MSVALNEPAMPLAARSGSRLHISLGLVAIVASVILVYASNSFLVAEVLGIKRVLQVVLVLLVSVGALTYGMRLRPSMVDPLIGFVLMLLITETFLRAQWVYVIDALSALLAVIVIYSVPAGTFVRGARFLVWICALFAAMALVQGLLLFAFPDLAVYRVVLTEEGDFDAQVRHPIMLLGLFGDPEYSLAGRPIARLQSFAREPSLNVIYFMIPGCVAMLLNSRKMFLIGALIMAYCLISLSGSVFLAFAFSGLWWLLLYLFSIRFAFSYGIPVLLAGYIVAIQRIGTDAMIAGTVFLAQYGDFFSKSASLTVRGTGAVDNLAAALGSPLGSSVEVDIAGPWLVNSALAAGWLGALMVYLFLRGLGKRLELVNRGHELFTSTRLGSLLLLGAMTTVVVFNDYQMSHYAGIVLSAFVSRAVRIREPYERSAP